MRVVVTGNSDRGLAKSLHGIWPDAVFCSRSTGYDLTTDDARERLSELAVGCDVFINSSALWRFNQVLVLDAVYKRCAAAGSDTLIICVGSTTDRATKGSDWLYQQEKKALRSYCNGLGLLGTWSGGPRVTLVSLGSLSNVQHKHPDRVCMDIDEAASYIEWVTKQPKHLTVNEISIDPRQRVTWNE